jgi:hypothetical protein
MKIESKVNSTKARIYKEDDGISTEYVVRVYNDTTVLFTYFTHDEIDAIQEAQLSLMGD